MATFDFPTTIRPASVRWVLRTNTQSHTSPLSGAVQTYELPGARWECTLEFKDLTREEIATLEAKLALLRGRAGRIRLWNHARETARGVATGLPLVRNLKNMVVQSDNLASASWIKNACTVVADAALDRYGLATADKIVESVTTASHHVRQNFTAAENAVMCLSADLRAGERSWGLIELLTLAGTTRTAYFDLAAGAVGTVGAGGIASITPLSAGLWRCSFAIGVGTGATTPVAIVGPAQANGVRSYLGDGVSGLYASALQLETGGPGDYLPTTTAPVEVPQSGRQLLTSGWTPNTASLLRGGDYISVEDRLHMVASQFSSDMWGNSTLTIEPPLRAAPADLATITTTRASAIFMLADDEQVGFDYSRALGSCSIRFVEALV